MSFRDGQAVFLPDGEQGRIIAAAEHACHVLVTTGALENEVLLLPHSDLTTQSSYDDGLDDALDGTPGEPILAAASTNDDMAEEIVNQLFAALRSRHGILAVSALSDNYLREGALAVLSKAVELIEE